MGNPTEHIEKAIQGLEAERDRIVKAILELRTTLAAMNNGGSGVLAEGGGKKGFQRKYEVNAEELIKRIGRANRSPLTVEQIFEMLTAQGYAFKKTTVGVNVRHLHEKGDARRVKAPKGSGFTFAYVFPVPQPIKEESDQLGRTNA
jgi:hypothetical protein